ncbi:MAG TPA: hypothetical protein VMU24_12795, partial [Candidatus Acidoferrales bacterium]|nr:hypothetical protein [Candidatus Acidoferrales bacterium]
LSEFQGQSPNKFMATMARLKRLLKKSFSGVMLSNAKHLLLGTKQILRRYAPQDDAMESFLASCEVVPSQSTSTSAVSRAA